LKKKDPLKHVFICCALMMTGCNSIFDFSPPSPASVVTNFATARDAAGQYKSAYYYRVSQTANGFQFFEVPIIGSAVTAVTAAAFKASTDVPLGAGIAGGTFSIFDNFYDPRDRALIYLAAHDAMACIERLAALGANAYENAALSTAALASVRNAITTEVAKPQPDKVKLAGLQTAIDVYTDGPSQIDDSINAINSNAVKQAISKASRPDYQTITSSLKQTSAQSNNNKSNNASITPADTMPPPGAPRGGATDVQIQAQVFIILDYSAQFTQNLATCKALGGSS
jgi:hypothetical protein